MSVQIIEKNGKPEWAVIPFSEYQKLQEAFEDAEDRKDIEKSLKAIQDGKELTVPAEVTFAILDGVSPVLAITIQDMASTLGVSRKTLSKIINCRGAVTRDMALRLSRAFDTTPELWMNLQRNYDLWHAAHDSTSWKSVKPIAGIPIPIHA